MDYIIDGAVLTGIADEIRKCSGHSNPIVPENMANEVAKCYEYGLAARTYETWTITLTDGSVIEKGVSLL